MTFFVQNIVEDHYFSFSAYHTENPLEFITVTLSFVNFSAKLRLIDLCCVNKSKIRSDLFLVVVWHDVVNQVNHISDIGVHLPATKIFKASRTYVSPAHHSNNLVQHWNIKSLQACVAQNFFLLLRSFAQTERAFPPVFALLVALLAPYILVFVTVSNKLNWRG